MSAQNPGSVRVTVNGTLGQNERFSWGYWLIANAVQTDSQAKLDALATAIATAITSRSTNFAAGLSSIGAYTDVKLYRYNTAGAPANFISQKPAAVTGAGTGSLPLQAAVCVSLRTQLPTRSGRGRLYLPASGYALTNHQLTSSQCSTISATVRGVLVDSVAAIGTGGNAIINSKPGAPLAYVDRCIVDSRLDVQRRRADSETVLFSSTTNL